MDASLEPLGQWAEDFHKTHPTRVTPEVQARMSAVITDNEHTLTLLRAMEAVDVSDRPRLDEWSIVTAQGGEPDPYLAPELRPTALAGVIHNHPLKTDGDTVTTSVLRYLHYEHAGGVAVTASRAFMLGPMDPEYAAYRAERGLSTTEMVVPEPDDSTKRKHESSDAEEGEEDASDGSPAADAESDA